MAGKLIRGVLIDPFARVVTQVDVDGSDAGLCAALYKLLGCDIVQSVSLGNYESLWCDEEGLLKPWGQQAFFRLGYASNQPFAGKSIILRTTPAGHMASSRCTVEQILSITRWLDPRDVRVPGARLQTLNPDGSIATDEPIGPAEYNYANQPG